MLEVCDLRAPQDVRDNEDRAAQRAILFLKSRLKRLTPEQTEKIEKKLDKWYTAWKKQTDTQRRRLVTYSDLIEGVVEDSNIPFEGASNITLHYPAGIARTFRAQFNKTAYDDKDLFYLILAPAARKQLEDQKIAVADLEEGFNYSFWGACNGLTALKEGTLPCVRDGTMVISGRWHREIRRCFDQRIYRSLEAFQKDYPDAAAAGIPDEAYQQKVDFFLAHADPDPQKQDDPHQDQPELIVGYDYDHVYKNEPVYTVGPYAKFVRYPLSIRELSEAMLYGYQVTIERDLVKRRGKRGEYYKAGVEKALAAKGQVTADSWDRALGFVEGLTPVQDVQDKPLAPVDGICRLDLDDDGYPETYQVVYDPEAKALLSLAPHRLRKSVDPSVAFRLVKRENRLDGVSLVGDCEDLFTQIDVNVRHRNNVRILTTSPIFLANQDYKDEIDLGRAENVIRPGVTYWVKEIDKAIKQMPVQDLSTTMDNMDEFKMYKEHVELVFGPTQGMSGKETPDDPRAPWKKTMLLMRQAGGRIDDYLDTFSESLPALADLHGALLFHYADGPTLKYTKSGKSLELNLDLLSLDGLSWGAKRRSVQLTPEVTMARLAMLAQTWFQLKPHIGMGDPIAKEIWNRHVRASGEPQQDKFILEGENMQAVQQSLMAAMQMNPQAPDNKAKGKGKEAFHKEIGKGAAQKLLAHAGAGPGVGQTGNGNIG